MILLWPPNAKSRLIGKDPDAGKDWGQEEKGVTENKIAGWHQCLSGHEFEQNLKDNGRQGSLACFSPWAHRQSGRTECLSNSNNKSKNFLDLSFSICSKGNNDTCIAFLIVLLLSIKYNSGYERSLRCIECCINRRGCYRWVCFLKDILGFIIWCVFWAYLITIQFRRFNSAIDFSSVSWNRNWHF